MKNKEKNIFLDTRLHYSYTTETFQWFFNPCPAEPGYMKKPTDLDLHCLPSRMQIYNNNLDQVTWLAEN